MLINVPVQFNRVIRLSVFVLVIFAFNLVFNSPASHSKFCINSSSFNLMFGTNFRSELLKRAHLMAVNDQKFEDYLAFSEDSDKVFVESLKNKVINDCNVIVGFYTSKECLIAGPFLKPLKKILASPTCAHNDVQKYLGNLFTGAPSLESYAKAMLKEGRRYKGSKIFIFFQPTDVFSFESQRIFRKINSLDIEFVSLSRDGSMENESLEKLAKTKNKVLVVLTYPVAAANALSFLVAKNIIDKNTYIIGSSSWVDDVSVFRTNGGFLAAAGKTIVPDIFDWEAVKKTSFFQRYKKLYGEEPLGIHVMSYDMTMNALKCYKVAKGKDFNLDAFNSCMRKPGGFKGVGGHVTFEQGSVFPKREIFFRDFKERI